MSLCTEEVSRVTGCGFGPQGLLSSRWACVVRGGEMTQTEQKKKQGMRAGFYMQTSESPPPVKVKGLVFFFFLRFLSWRRLCSRFH